MKWLPTEDRGPNGAVGKGTFDPSFAVALIVTVYGVSTFQYTHVHVYTCVTSVPGLESTELEHPFLIVLNCSTHKGC